MTEEILITCNGKELTVRRVGAIKICLKARPDGPPLMPCGWRLVDEKTAATELRVLTDLGYYENVLI